jgi:hypothetical protein
MIWIVYIMVGIDHFSTRLPYREIVTSGFHQSPILIFIEYFLFLGEEIIKTIVY